jgi:hypothetical protein
VFDAVFATELHDAFEAVLATELHDAFEAVFAAELHEELDAVFAVALQDSFDAVLVVLLALQDEFDTVFTAASSAFFSTDAVLAFDGQHFSPAVAVSGSAMMASTATRAAKRFMWVPPGPDGGRARRDT